MIEPRPLEHLLEEAVGWSDTELDDAIRACELEARALAARRAVVLAVIEHRRTYAADGHRSLNAYLRATIDASGGEIARQRKLAQLVEAAPEVGDALLDGRIGTDHALEIDRIRANPRVGHLLAAVAPVFVELAEHRSYDDFRADVAQFVTLVDLDGAFSDLASDVEHRTARVSDVGGTLDVVATGGHPLTAARLTAIFRGFVEAEHRRDVAARRAEHGDAADGHPLARTAAQRRFDALVAIFDAAAGSPAGRELPEPTVHVLIDHRTLDEAFTRAGLTLPNGDVVDLGELAETDGTMLGALVDGLVDELRDDPRAFLSRRCETSSGAAIHPIVALQAALTGHIRRVVVDSAGVVVDYGSKQRLFTGSARLAAQVLARTCSHPGCRIAAVLCDVDHVDEWHAGGLTNQRNADIRCRSHNRFKHRERWRTRRDSFGRVYHLRPDGTIVLPVGERPPDLTADEHARLVRARVAVLSGRDPSGSAGSRGGLDRR